MTNLTTVVAGREIRAYTLRLHPHFFAHSAEAPEIWLLLEAVGTEVVYTPSGAVLAYNLTAVVEADMWSDTVLVGTPADADKMHEGVRPELVETSD